MYAGKLYVFTNGIGFYFSMLSYGVYLYFFSLFDKFGHHNRMIFRYFSS